MAERDKVVKAFEFCLMPPSREELENDICSHEDCPYYREYNGGKCVSALAADALALLKAQEPVEPIPGLWDRDIQLYKCGACGGEIGAGGIAKYCFHCGQAVKWG